MKMGFKLIITLVYLTAKSRPRITEESDEIEIQQTLDHRGCHAYFGLMTRKEPFLSYHKSCLE